MAASQRSPGGFFIHHLIHYAQRAGGKRAERGKPLSVGFVRRNPRSGADRYQRTVPCAAQSVSLDSSSSVFVRRRRASDPFNRFTMLFPLNYPPFLIRIG